MPRLVLDTNVVVSAHLNPHGLERAVLNWALGRGFFVSEAVLAEYAGVLQRKKFKIAPEFVATSLQLIRSRATIVNPKHMVHELKDESDNRFLECAEAADADFLVTGNQRHFPKRWGKTRVVNAREVLEFLPPAWARD